MAAYLFDIDGVITDPEDRIVKHPDLITYLVSYLYRGEPIGLISGRAISWQIDRVISLIENFVKNNPELPITILDNLFVSGEFGGVVALYEKGKRVETIDKTFAIPQKLFEHLKKASQQFTDYVFFDEDKQTQVSLEMNPGSKEDAFSQYKGEIASKLREMVGDEEAIQVHVDRIAINVKHKDANKHYATAQFIAWLEQKELKPKKFYVFGDSPSDLEMGEELLAQEKDLAFIFVGNEKELQGKNPKFPVIVTKQHCDEGTIAFLRSLGSPELPLGIDKRGNR